MWWKGFMGRGNVCIHEEKGLYVVVVFYARRKCFIHEENSFAENKNLKKLNNIPSENARDVHLNLRYKGWKWIYMCGNFLSAEKSFWFYTLRKHFTRGKNVLSAGEKFYPWKKVLCTEKSFAW